MISGLVPSKSPLPIIQNILFKLSEGRLQLTATDLENSMQADVAVDDNSGDNSLSVALPPKLLQDTLKSLAEQPLRFALDPDKFSVTITSDNGEYRINGYDGKDFPTFKKPDDTQSLQIPAHILTKAIQRTLFAVSDDELKPAMTGVFFNFTPEATTFVATDAHRLVRYERKDITTQKPDSFILPHKALKFLISAVGNSIEESVSLEYNDRNAFFEIGNSKITCRRIDARFPDYENVIPKSSPNKVIINKKDLLASIKRLHIYSNKTTHLGKFAFEGNMLNLQAEDIDYANQAKESLHCLYEGQKLEIGFNIGLMIDLINNSETDDVIIELDHPSRAAIILPSVQDDDEKILMLLMPVMLSSYY